MFEVEWFMLHSCAVDFPAFSVLSSYPHSMFLHSVSKQAVPRYLHKCQCMGLPLREPVRGGGTSLSHCPLPPCLGLGTHAAPRTRSLASRGMCSGCIHLCSMACLEVSIYVTDFIS